MSGSTGISSKYNLIRGEPGKESEFRYDASHKDMIKEEAKQTTRGPKMATGS